MKITKSQLRRIIKEELSNTLKEFVGQPSDEEKLVGMRKRCATSERGPNETYGQCMKRERAAAEIYRDPMQHAGPGGVPTAMYTGRRYQEGAKNEELASLDEAHPDYGPENEPPRGTTSHRIWTMMQCNCKELVKSVDEAEAGVSGGRGGPDAARIVARNVKTTKERCPECFREDEKTTQEPEAAMGPEGPIMKKPFQERNKMTKGRLEEIIKEELSAALHEKEPLDEIFGFSKAEKFKKLRKKIEQEMEAGTWVAERPHPTKQDGTRWVADDISGSYSYALVPALAKKELGMELNETEQESYAYYFEGGYEGGAERAKKAGVEQRAQMYKDIHQRGRATEREHEKGVASRRKRKEIFGKIKKYLENSRDLRGMSDRELQDMSVHLLAQYLRRAEGMKDRVLPMAKRLADLDKDEKSTIGDVEYVLERDIRKLKKLTRGYGKPDFPQIIGRGALQQFQSNDYRITNLGSGRYQVDLAPGKTGRAMYRED